MLRYRADLRTLSFVSIYFGLVAYQWVTAPKGLAIAVPLFILTCWFSFFGAVATHNTIHSPVFKSRPLNRIFQVVLTLTYGAPVSSFVPGHNLSHHKYTQQQRDVMRTTKTRHRWNLLNGLFFVLHVAGAIMKGEGRYFRAMRERNPAWARQMATEWIILHGAYLVLLCLDWKKFLLYVAIPHKYAAWGIVTMNLLQHDGCDAKSEYNHSRNFVGKLVNWWTFNNGFHTIHHMEPGLHWSLLPAEHAKRVAPFIHPNLDQPALLPYLWRTFFWPGKRVDYLGNPLVLPEAGPDEEWIPAPKETPDDLGAVASG
ncbi:MAG: fatty acid desaturase [Minicystis sp.]